MADQHRQQSRHALSIEALARLCDAPEFVAHYRESLGRMNLWRSEEILFAQLLEADDRILDLGCGAGRVSFGLWDAGFRSVEGLDISPGMIAAARDHAKTTGRPIPFQVGDATALPHPDDSFDAVIFGFGGLMQIPGRGNRRTALSEIHRITKPHGSFIFTTHDRAIEEYRDFWEKAAREGPPPDGFEFGDIYEPGPHGVVFVHIPDLAEVNDDLEATGWSGIQTHLREDIADEDEIVEELTDPCRFWIARKPAAEESRDQRAR